MSSSTLPTHTPVHHSQNVQIVLTLTLYQPMTHICVMSVLLFFHKSIRIYMEVIILGTNTLYSVFCFFKALLPEQVWSDMVGKGLTYSPCKPTCCQPVLFLGIEHKFHSIFRQIFKTIHYIFSCPRWKSQIVIFLFVEGELVYIHVHVYVYSALVL